MFWKLLPKKVSKSWKELALNTAQPWVLWTCAWMIDSQLRCSVLYRVPPLQDVDQVSKYANVTWNAFQFGQRSNFGILVFQNHRYGEFFQFDPWDWEMLLVTGWTKIMQDKNFGQSPKIYYKKVCHNYQPVLASHSIGTPTLPSSHFPHPLL